MDRRIVGSKWVVWLGAALTVAWPGAAWAGEDLVRYVNPFIGTGEGAPDYSLGNAAGNTPPGAAYPFGMVLWSPDTTHLAGGYRYSHDKINGFSLTHISGRGIACYQDIPFQPVAGEIGPSPGRNWSSYAASFRHENESASPGYYRVKLDNGITAELSVTPRTGFARFVFDAMPRGTILVNTGGSAQGNRDRGTAIRVDGKQEISGAALSGDCGGWFDYQVFFAAEFDRPFSSYGAWSGGKVTPRGQEASGGASGLYLVFDTAANPVVHVRVALSYVSAAQARQNLRAENGGWNLEQVRQSAADAWNARLNTIRVSGGTDSQKRVFYTALYHAFIHPTIFSDADGQYLGFDNQVHSTHGRIQFHNFAAWDMYRSQMPLMALLAPETSDMMQSLVNDAEQDPGGGLPRWEHANTNSGGMLGDSQDAVIATAYAFGARNFDTAAALKAMEKGALDVTTTSGGTLVRMGLADYLTLGYVSTATPDSGSRTLEYATDDFSIAQFAKALGKIEKHDLYLRRAQNWRNLFYAGYMVPRRPEGTFMTEYWPSSGYEYVEGSMAQYTWMVPFNMRGLIDRMGDNKIAVERLDAHFAELNGGPWSDHAFMGNEPSLKTPWVYNFAGAPWRTQAVVRRITERLFRDEPAGLPGNDDLGTLSAWYVFAAVGLYPHIPGVAGFVVGSPLFPSITIQMANGATLRIVAPEAAADRPYVQTLKVNGKSHNSPWIPWESVSAGGVIEFALSDTPNKEWGADAAAAPPSYDVPAGDGALKTSLPSTTVSNASMSLISSSGQVR